LKNVITISREFGSGGRTVGRLVANALGYKFYDGEIIDEVVKNSGLSRDIVEKYDEYATYKNSFLYTIAVNAGGDSYSGLSFANRVQIAQAEVIRKLADEGSCVIIGRGADYILRHREDCLNVFVRADMSYRARRVIENYGETNVKIEDRLRDKDTRRRVFYRSFTMREWGAIENYNLMLDSGVIGIEKCADIICQVVKCAD
jgi:cytidylate kinase